MLDFPLCFPKIILASTFHLGFPPLEPVSITEVESLSLVSSVQQLVYSIDTSDLIVTTKSKLVSVETPES